ncbi:unnamed protein product [Urochloa decumbens]|uniref:Coatomer subunit delta n=1 Tax=Urochloa decumbens TaxID=240449 RepID=A0ABC9ET78_9POAL
MVVLAASIVSKSGKALVSRQFVDMSRIRIEGLLAAFPKLVGTGKQHTYVETENVRYVYQPIEGLYLLLITNKQSNILEDLDTLRLLSKLVPEYSPSLDEEGVCKTAFLLIFAFDEAISLVNKENVTVQQVKQYCEMESHEEKAHKLMMQAKINETKDVMKKKANELDKMRMERGGLSADMDSFASKPKGRPSTAATAPGKGLGMKLGKTQKTNQFLESLKAEGEVILEDVQPSTVPSRSSAVPPSDPVTVTIEEKLNVVVKRDGGINNFDVQGTLALQVLNDADGFIQLQIESQDIPGLSFKTHPNINQSCLTVSKCWEQKIQTGPSRVVKMKLLWDGRIIFTSVSQLLAVECCHIYTSASVWEAPNVKQIDGEWKFDSRNSALEWSILLIDQSNRSGSMEFVVPAADPSSFFPISVGFSASSTFSDLKVTGIHPLKEGNPPKFSQRARLLTANYQVV